MNDAYAEDRCGDVASLPAQVRFTISANERAITCWTCRMTSYHPGDVAERYRAFCNVFHRP